MLIVYKYLGIPICYMLSVNVTIFVYRENEQNPILINAFGKIHAEVS